MFYFQDDKQDRNLHRSTFGTVLYKMCSSNQLSQLWKQVSSTICYSRTSVKRFEVYPNSTK